jgi:uncharacterized protein
MFRKLLPKEERYFEDCWEITSVVEEISVLTYAFFTSGNYNKDIFLKLKPLKKLSSEITSKVVKRLRSNFIAPLDPVDIYSLINRIDIIGDMLLGAVEKIDTYCLTVMIDGAEEIASIIVRQIKELKKVVMDLKHRNNQLNEWDVIQDLGTDAINAYRSSLKKLFTEEKDPISLIKKKEILEILKNASEYCHNTSDLIISILIKNS